MATPEWSKNRDVDSSQCPSLTALALIMLAQSATGLLLPGQYRDIEWIRARWFGNDWVTLTAGVPLLVVAVAGGRRGSGRGLLLWLGTVAYAAYNYAFYLFGAALNAFFLLYVAAVVFAAAALIVALPQLGAHTVTHTIRPTR